MDDISFESESPTASLEDVVGVVYGPSVTVSRRRPIGGGSINKTEAVELSDRRTVFVKTNSSRHEGLFTEEARGLRALTSDRGPRIPQPLAIVTSPSRQFLFLEYIEPGRQTTEFYRDLGRTLAALHRHRRSDRCGFEGDNHIGSTPQLNGWDSDWFRFFGEKRLLFQLRLARKQGYADAAMEKQVEIIIRRLPELLPPLDGAQPSLLHGDLWGGNVIVGPAGEPVLIDPAVYYGHREADIAMTELFGGFGGDFYRSYNEEWPLEPGFSRRKDVYNLYHLLNHLNLFGTSYLGSCRAILRSYSRTN